MRVGYVLKMYPRLSETFIVNEILELERRGVDVTVFSLRVPREGRFHEKLARVRAEVVYLPDRGPAELLRLVATRRERFEPVRDLVGAFVWDEIRRSETPSVKLPSKALDLALEAEARGIEHFHAHFATSATAAADMASRLTGIPFSFTAHAKDIYLDAHDPADLRGRMQRARFVVTVCDANREHLRREMPVDTPVHRILNGLDLEEFSAAPARAEGRFRILGVGRLVEKKGFDLLVEACRALHADGRDFECVIAGDGPERDALERAVRSAGLGDRVALLGAVPNGRVRAEMADADVIVLPCRVAGDGNRDALPTVLLEAIALGRPFVSTPVTGIPEIAGDDEAGLLVPENDAAALARTLARLADSPALRAELAEGGRRRAERLFDVRRSVGALVSLFAGNGAAPVAAAVEDGSCVSST